MWLIRVAESQGELGSLLFLVNDPGEVLRRVSVDSFGIVTFDDVACALGGTCLQYTDVPRERRSKSMPAMTFMNT